MGNVFNFYRTQIIKTEVKFFADLIEDGARYEDHPRIGHRLKPRGDIDPVAI